MWLIILIWNILIAVVGICIGYIIGVNRCTKKLEKALEEMTEVQNNV